MSEMQFRKVCVLKRNAKNYKKNFSAVLDVENIPDCEVDKDTTDEVIAKYAFLTFRRFRNVTKRAALLLDPRRVLVVQSRTKWKREAVLVCLSRYAARHGFILQVRRW